MAENFVSFKSLKGRVPFSRAHLIRLEQDGKFPRRVKLGECRVAWIEAEVDEWIENRIAERDGQA
jgi:prophage regulatory protein